MTHGGNVWQGESPEAWLDFSANLRPEGPPDWVKKAMTAGLREARYYPDPAMHRERAALGAFLGLEAEAVLPTAGGVSALDLAMGVGASGVLLADPCFSEYEELAKRHGLPVRRASLLKGPRQAGDPAELLSAHLFEGCLVCLCNPSNPLGAAFSRETVAALLARVESAGGWLLADEAFIEYCLENSARALVAHHERLMLAGSMTKILGVPGVRLGYLSAAPEALKALAARQNPWAVGCVASAVVRALPGHAADVRADAARSAIRRADLKRALEGLGAFVYDSEAPFLLTAFDRPVAPLAAALRARGILVRECMDFHGIDDGRHLRLAVKDEAANRRLTDTIGEVLTCGENR